MPPRFDSSLQANKATVVIQWGCLLYVAAIGRGARYLETHCSCFESCKPSVTTNEATLVRPRSVFPGIVGGQLRWTFFLAGTFV